MRFKATIKVHGLNPYVRVSAAQTKRLKPGWKKPLPVLVRINGKPDDAWAINMMPAGDGTFLLYLHGKVRKASDTKVGDRVDVDIEFNADYKGGPARLPDWFAKPLRGHDAATQGWKALTPSRQKEIVRYLTSLKSPESRTRNVEKALRMLSGEKGRYMARDWN